MRGYYLSAQREPKPRPAKFRWRSATQRGVTLSRAREARLHLRPGPATLVAEQPPFHLQPAAVSAQRAVRGDDPVAGQDERNWVPAIRGAHGARCGRLTDGARQFRVRPGGPGWDGPQRGPDPPLEGRALRVGVHRIDG